MNLTKTLKLFLALGCAGLLLSACSNSACSNTNPVLAEQDPASEEYKAELAKQLRSEKLGKLTYWLDEYLVEDGKEYLTIRIIGDGLCAKSNLLVTNWQKLEGIKRTKGAGYAGAELEGLRFRVQEDAGSISFVYEDVARVVD